MTHQLAAAPAVINRGGFSIAEKERIRRISHIEQKTDFNDIGLVLPLDALSGQYRINAINNCNTRY
jgi:hypothetical protein